MRRAGHAGLARALGGSLLNPFLKRLVEIDGLIAVHGRTEAGCPPLREGLHFPLSRKSQIPKCSVDRREAAYIYLVVYSIQCQLQF